MGSFEGISSREVTIDKYIISLFRNLSRLKSIPVFVELEKSRYRAAVEFSPKRGIEPAVVLEHEALGIETGKYISILIPGSEWDVFFEATVKSPCIDGTFNIGIPDSVRISIKESGVVPEGGISGIKSLGHVSAESIEKILRNKKPDQASDFKAKFKEIESFIDKLQKADSIFEGVAYGETEEEVSFGRAFKVYDGTFLGNEVVLSKGAAFEKDPWTWVYYSLADNLLSRPEFKNLILYLPEENSWQIDTMLKAEEIIGDKDSFSTGKCRLYSCTVQMPELRAYTEGPVYQTVMEDDPEKFLRFFDKNLSNLAAEAFSYNLREFFLEKLKESYEKHDYFKERALVKISENGNIKGFAVLEACSEGLDPFWENDLVRIYPAAENEGSADIDRLALAVLPKANEFFRRFAKESFNLIVNGEDFPGINLPGVEEMGLIREILMNRPGIYFFKKLLTDNFIDLVKYYDLTQPQLGIWQTEKMYPATSFGNITGTARIEGELDFESFEKAINIALEENDGYRIRIAQEGGTVKQYFKDYEYYRVQYMDFSFEGGNEAYEKWSMDVTRTPFQLIDSDLFYFVLLKFEENKHGMFIKTHHISTDAWTDVSQVSYIVDMYSKLKNGIEVKAGKKLSYIDFIYSEREFMDSQRFSKQKEFWDKLFSTMPEFNSIKATGSTYRNISAIRKSIVVEKSLSEKINALCEEVKCSPFVLFLSFMYIYIYRITSKGDMVIGAPVLNRSNAREKEMVGMIVSIIPIRHNIQGGSNILSMLKQITKEWTVLLKNQKYPLNMIQRNFREKHKVNDNIYDVIISFQNAKLNKTELTGDYMLDWHFSGYQSGALQLHISDRNLTNEYVLDFDYLSSLFEAGEIDRMADCYLTLIEDGVNNPNKEINLLEMLSKEEKRKVILDFNSNTRDFPKEKTLQELFKIQVQKGKDRIAVEYGEKKLTYEELDRNSDILAARLRSMGVGPDSIVGVMACRSLELMVGIMGILKAGGAYLPINPGYPASRISYILKDSGAGVLLVNKPCNEDVIFSGKVLDIGNELSKDDMEPLTETRGEGSSSNNLAYVIYTSGSTGEPKGAMIEHRSLVNFLYTMFNMYEGGISPEDRCLSISNISFDASVCEIFLPLVFGACLVLNEDSDYLDVVRLSEIITEKAITFTYIPPSLLMDLAMLLKKSGRRIMLDKLFVGAEPIKSKVLKEYLLLNPSMKILNGYGPTEATIVASFYLFDGTNSTDDSNVPIGKPIQNMQIYILDKNMQPVPVNVPGEIHIGGEGVCRGYLNLPDLTAERFIENPFFQGRMYKTGDLAKWLPDGNIKFIGREDNQVKIRGLRIEIGEIENQLLKIEKINEAVVMVKEDQEGNKFLCGYFTASENIAAREIKAFLSKVMPEFMIPRYFVQMEEMPLTLNGKVNKGLLPEPALEVKAAFEYTPPSNDIEEKLVKAWKEVLKVESIGVNDNIFDYEVDSLTIMRVLVNVLEYGWDISMQDFYVYLTIRDLAKKIMGNNPDTEKALNHEQKVIKLKENRELLQDLSLEEPKNIFVTGATGYLGMHIIESAILHTEADIYCLVRGKSFLSAKERLLEKLEFYFEDRYNGLVDERIFVVEGDISKERMGLDERVYRDLCAKIDLVIHGAALVKHFGDYDRFKDTNIYGTENMIAFCRESGAKLNYISTISISGDLFKQDRDDMEFSENDLYIGQSFDENVYIKSKFQAEKIIFKAAEKGLKASVFRVGNLTGRYSDGHFQSNIHENRFYNTLKFYIQLGMVSSGDLSRKVEFTPVDICAEAIVKLAKIRSNDGLRAYHLFNSNSLELKEVIDILNSLGCSIEMVEEEAFSCILEDAVKEDGKKELMLNVINDIYGSSRRVFEPSVNVTSEISNLFLERLNISWPRIQEDYIKKIYVYMNESGFLDMNCGVKA